MHKGDRFSRDISSHGVYVYAEWRTQRQRDAEKCFPVAIRVSNPPSDSPFSTGIYQLR